MVNEGTTSKGDKPQPEGFTTPLGKRGPTQSPGWSPPNSPNNRYGTSVASIVEQLVAEVTDVQSFVFMCISLCVEHNPIGTTGGSEETFDVEW